MTEEKIVRFVLFSVGPDSRTSSQLLEHGSCWREINSFKHTSRDRDEKLWRGSRVQGKA